MRTARILAVLLVSGLVVWASPPKADAFQCMVCPNELYETPGQWGMGSTCAEAEHNALLAAYYWIRCSTCTYGNERIVTPCHFEDGMWKADGAVEYACWEDFCY